MDDLEPRMQRNIRIDKNTGQASVKDVVWAVTGREGSAATQLTKALVAKHKDTLDGKIRDVRIDGKGQETPVASFAVLTDVIFLVRAPSRSCHVAQPAAVTYPSVRMQVETCLRESKRTLEKKFDIARTLGKLMDADPGPLYRWAEGYVHEYHSCDKPCPAFLVEMLSKE